MQDPTPSAPTQPTEPPRAFYDHSTTCQKCGRKVRLGGPTPAPIDLDYVCIECRSESRYD